MSDIDDILNSDEYLIPYEKLFNDNLEWITSHDGGPVFVLGRDACGPFVALDRTQKGFVRHPHLLEALDGPSAQMARDRLREEQEKDKREGVRYDRCGPPIS
jgi:hypothetical protein